MVIRRIKMLKKISTDKAPAAIGPYSQGIIAGDTLYASGQIPINPATGAIEAEGIEAQAEQAIKNAGEILKAAGVSYDAVVKTTCFLADMWKEFFDTVKGYARVKKYNAVAGVANVGDMKDWCGSDMTQVNWYAFGRMAWNDAISPKQIADEWLKQTYTTEKAFVEPMTDVLLESREAVVRYMMPLGLHHIFAGGHHYGPEPWCDPQGWREDWKPKYYHKADKNGLGFDRSMSGSQNARQYPDALFNKYNKVEECPEQLLLWFHHVPWTHKMHNGETMWEALCHTYDQGVRQAEAFARVWEQMKPYVDAERYNAQKLNFDRQAKDAWWWRDACLLYFQQFSGMKLPLDCPSPKYKLQDLMKYNLPIDNYTRAPFDKLP